MWLREKLPSVESAAKYLPTSKGAGGLIGGAGFYTELPSRYACDGITQCYAVHAFRQLARLFRAVDREAPSTRWLGEATALARSFTAAFWRGDHFGEYVHPARGLVDAHGLSDVNFAAVAFDTADEQQMNDRKFGFHRQNWRS